MMFHRDPAITKRLVTASLCLVICLSACSAARENEVISAPTADETQAILDIIGQLEEAANEAAPEKAEAVLLLDDERFSEIEDFISKPIGADRVRSLHDWIRQNGEPGDNVRFTEIDVYPLSAETAYATAIQELNFDTPGKSRVTFVFLKQDGNWGVIHAHYSTMP
jgi:hypothetical protein